MSRSSAGVHEKKATAIIRTAINSLAIELLIIRISVYQTLTKIRLFAYMAIIRGIVLCLFKFSCKKLPADFDTGEEAAR